MKHTAAILKGRFSGFALVVTLSLMILLTIVAVGLLTLASISLRSTSQGEAMATARANARLSLMVALGELQRQAGPDTRVTARADIRSASNPPVLGVWKSWEGLNHETSGNFIGRPRTPDYTLKDPGSNSPDKRFLAWLTSANATTANVASVPNTVAGAGKVTLLGEGSVGTEADRQIHLEPTSVSTGKQAGSMAWWIGGENQKAYLPKPPAPPSSGIAIARKNAVTLAQSSSVVDPKPFDLESVLADPDRGKDEAIVNKVSSLNQADFLAPDQSAEPIEDRRSRQHFHDLSTTAIGLLTNTATGGWRKDMSLLSEKWATATDKADLPLFRLTPEPVETTKINGASTSEPTPEYSLFYPWIKDYATSPSGQFSPQQAIASWDNLMDYVTFYKKYPTATARTITLPDPPVDMRNDGPTPISTAQQYEYFHKVRTEPVIARIQFVFSHAVTTAPDPANPTQNLYTPKLLMTPVITLWNPYNATITMPYVMYFEFKVIPVALSYQIGGTVNNFYNSIMYTNDRTRPTNNRPALIDYRFDTRSGPSGIYNTCEIRPGTTGIVLRAGEAKVFSPGTNDTNDVIGGASVRSADTTLVLQPGYFTGGGLLYPVRVGNEVDETNFPPEHGVVRSQSAGTSIKARIAFNTNYIMQFGTNGVGNYMEVRTFSDKTGFSFAGERYLRWMRTGYSVAVAESLHPNIDNDDDVLDTTMQALENNPMPFLSTIFGPRIATRVTPVPGEMGNEQYVTKGITQSSPFTHFPHATYTPPNGSPSNYFRYPGTGNPINYGYEYSYAVHKSGAASPNLPNAGLNGEGYIISGVQSSSGIPRAIIADLPVRPLASLGELVGWDLRFENPVPPFGYNLIGNSDASPLLPANDIAKAAEKNNAGNKRHDDAYCANHLLFDDWFFSTITPDPATFVQPPLRAQTNVFGEFVSGVTPLTNRAYKPILQDKAFVAAGNSEAKLYDDYIRPTDSWKTIASRLEVEGMFNVNSTSVAAWRALLGHARNQRVLHMTNTGGYSTANVIKQHPVTRYPVAGSDEAGTTSPTGVIAKASQITGYRTLTEPFLDELAEEIVKQVRLRGPFLSLAEFINRQLSNDTNLAIAGALQAALNELTKNTDADNPLAPLQANDVSSPIVVPPTVAGAENALGYDFPEAAVGESTGFSAYGVPGWTRQSDILRPIAPILSARDDTFTIRGYGDARDASGNVTAKAVCEAVVRRTRDYVDPADAADSVETLKSEANKTFGRRFEIISFRWLAPDEV